MCRLKKGIFGVQAEVLSGFRDKDALGCDMQ